MKKILFGIGAVVLIVIIVYFSRLQIYDSITDLTEEQIKKEIETHSDSFEVQDIIFINERNVFVPVIFDNVNHGMTAWKWTSNKKWELQSLDTHGGPILWNVEDGSEPAFIWNMTPDEQVAGINFYLIRDRNAWISMYIPTYLPRIQLEHHIPLDEKGYGVLKMPKEWVNLLEKLSKDESKQGNDLLQNSHWQDEIVHFGWRTVDNKGQLRYIESTSTQGGYGFSTGDEFQMILELHEGEVEFGK